MKKSAKPVSQQDILAGLRRLGIQPGDVLGVHSSLGSHVRLSRVKR